MVINSARRVALLIAFAFPLVLVGSALGANAHANYRAVCPGPVFSGARCHAQVVTDGKGNPAATASPTGYGPEQFHGAYGLPTSAASLQTIAIVDAFNSPTITNDLALYSQTFALPVLPACATPSSQTTCFAKVNQSGGTGSYPRKDAGWALEIALDVETAHAVCQDCKILLVEAKSNSFSNLAAAEDTAARLGANVISNSYGGSEFSSETSSSYDGHFDHAGVAITVSSGDGGYGVEYPGASRFVTAVGGTTLSLDANNQRTSETAWSGSGSGCSAYEPKPSWQTDTGCPRRTVADVSADADPGTGAAVYDTTPFQGQSGWFKVGGTSLAAPLVAGVYALAANGGSVTYGSYPYAHASLLFDVLTGSNGSCGIAYLCTAGSGFDGPTGLGTPSGTGGF
jgi:subtilase family serine protease